MKARFVSLLLVAALLVSPALPVAAAPLDQQSRNPNDEVAKVVTFETVTIQSNRSGLGSLIAPLAGGCKTYTLGVRGYSVIGYHIWTYAWNIYWCYNGSTITSLSKWRTIWTEWGWSFKGDIADYQSGGLGKPSYWHYAQGDFCFLETWTCVTHSYPWVNQTVYGTGAWMGSAGGN